MINTKKVLVNYSQITQYLLYSWLVSDSLIQLIQKKKKKKTHAKTKKICMTILLIFVLTILNIEFEIIFNWLIEYIFLIWDIYDSNSLIKTH